MNEPSPSPDQRRDTFLLAMYREVWNNINRHMTVVWQPAGVLVGAFALFALVDKGTLNIDVASTLLTLIASWLIVHTYDANAWFTRNLVIVANIERQFLRPSDEREIHFFFTKHREPGDVVGHFRVHRNLGVGLALVVLGYHFVTRMVPCVASAWSSEKLQCFLPYATALVCMIWIWRFRNSARDRYVELLKRSPGA